MIVTDESLNVLGARQTKDVSSILELTQSIFDSAKTFRITEHTCNTYLDWCADSATVTLNGFGTMVGGSCRGDSFQYNKGWRSDIQSYWYDTEYANGAFCLTDIQIKYDFSNYLHLLSSCDGECANINADFV